LIRASIFSSEGWNAPGPGPKGKTRQKIGLSPRQLSRLKIIARENKVEIRGVFFHPRERLLSHHIYHAFHHVYTSKKPRPGHAFF
jgi:hypothetical protein